jgi:hypothetical protein
MVRVFMGIVLGVLVCFRPAIAAEPVPVYPYAISICSVIINEMTEGKVSLDEARNMSLAIARAGNIHFGRVTCGDMWLFMAIAHVESGFKTNIVNDQNCRGMFQVHAPSWARKFGIGYGDLLDLKTNAYCGIAILKYYLGLYKTMAPALSAYNSDHPRAAMGYAWAVLSTRQRIKRRYTELYRVIHERKQRVASRPSL